MRSLAASCVCTARRGEISPRLAQTLSAWGALTIRLEPLSLDGTRGLLSSLIGVTQAFPVFSQWLHTRSGGNPFFALEVLKNLFETGRLHAANGEWHSVLDQITRDYAEFEMPDTVHDLVLRRVAQLPIEAQRVAEAASVIGQRLDAPMLIHLTGLERSSVTDALETLELADVLRPNGFRHDLMRQSIYKGLSESRRTALHASAAQLTSLEPLRRADHALLAGQPTVALPLLLEVGAVLNRQGLLLEARKVLQRVLDCDPDQLEALAMLAGLAMQTKDDALADRYSQRVLNAPCDPLTRARALNVKAGLLYNAGQISQAAPVIEEAIQITGHLERTDADLEETAFDIFESEARYDDAIRILEPAVARLRRFGDSGALSTCLSSLAAIYDDTGRYSDALALHSEALETAKRAGAGYAQVGAAVQMMWGLNHAGRSDEAVQLAYQALALGEYSNSEYLRNGLAASLMKLERTEEAIMLYEDNAKRGQVTTRALAWGRLASLYAGRGDLDAARRAATLSLECALQTQVYFARIRAAIAVLQYGSDEQVSVILPLVEHQISPDKDAQLEFEAALATR
jgi:tetratricopeptide (TPR) repeat protein